MKSAARAALVPLLLAAAAMAAEKGSSLQKDSPFQPAGTAAAPAEGAGERIEFAGVSSVGKKTDLIFYDKTAKKSHWIGIGETKEGISVLNYDERREQAVVKIDGAEKVLALRKVTPSAARAGGGAVVSHPSGFNTPPPVAMPVPTAVMPPVSAANSGDASVANPSAGQPAATPSTPPAPQTPQAKQETEARMLVSDLLEIGMAQRKAYEEAQRKAAEGGNASTSTTPSAPATPPPQPAK